MEFDQKITLDNFKAQYAKILSEIDVSGSVLSKILADTETATTAYKAVFAILSKTQSDLEKAAKALKEVQDEHADTKDANDKEKVAMIEVRKSHDAYLEQVLGSIDKGLSRVAALHDVIENTEADTKKAQTQCAFVELLTRNAQATHDELVQNNVILSRTTSESQDFVDSVRKQHALELAEINKETAEAEVRRAEELSKYRSSEDMHKDREAKFDERERKILIFQRRLQRQADIVKPGLRIVI